MFNFYLKLYHNYCILLGCLKQQKKEIYFDIRFNCQNNFFITDSQKNYIKDINNQILSIKKEIKNIENKLRGLK